MSRAGKSSAAARRCGGCFVEPAWSRAPPQMPLLQHEIFAPILYLIAFDDLEQVIGGTTACRKVCPPPSFTNLHGPPRRS